MKITSELSYGLGVVVGTQNGLQVVTHDGGTAGFRSELLILPEHGVGVVILSNGVTGRLFNSAVERRLIELLFDGNAEAQEDMSTAIDPAWLAELTGAWVADGLGWIELRSEKGGAVFDAGEWKVAFGKKTDTDGTVKIVTTSAPMAGIELIPRDKDGRKVLVLEEGQHSYVFERVER